MKNKSCCRPRIMKLKILSSALLISTLTSAVAQDSLQVSRRNGQPYIVHKVRTGETLFMLAKRFKTPPATLADLNQVSYQQGLQPGSEFLIPVGRSNYVSSPAQPNTIPLYYYTVAEDDLPAISRMFLVTQSTVQRWNNMDDTRIKSNQRLHTGWISYDAAQIPFGAVTKSGSGAAELKTALPVAGTNREPVKVIKKTVEASGTDSTEAAPGAYQIQFESRLSQGSMLNEESGAALLYPLKTKLPEGTYYAFHNTAARGTIIKVHNPANDRVVYAKVIGRIPDLKEYHNVIIGISSNAAEAIGAREKKLFCKLSY
jgi:LysM repeat protein